MQTLERILLESKRVDEKFLNTHEKELSSFKIDISVPTHHPRASSIESYVYKVGDFFAELDLNSNDLVLFDCNLNITISEDINSVALDPVENKLKNIEDTNKFIKTLSPCSRIIGIGGGLVLNAVGYVAESMGVDLVYVPTTITAAADSVVGGKVRMNRIQDGKSLKHSHKTFYEPNLIFLNPLYLETLGKKELTVGLAEVIKHSLYQSDGLKKFLTSDEFDPITNKQSLLKAILWTVDLKKKALDVDPEETLNGSYYILRAGHDISDKIEEESGLTIPHTAAVLTGMYRDLIGKEKCKDLEVLYKKFELEDYMYL